MDKDIGSSAPVTRLTLQLAVSECLAFVSHGRYAREPPLQRLSGSRACNPRLAFEPCN